MVFDDRRKWSRRVFCGLLEGKAIGGTMTLMRFGWMRALVLAFVLAAEASAQPFEAGTGFVSLNAVDGLVLAKLRALGIAPANRCSDEVFVRRVYLDVIGTLPEPEAVRSFLKDARPDKRAVLIDALLEDESFADYWALKWGDLLRIKAEFPINLWPNAVQAYHRWVRESLRENKPYDQFVRALLTSSGSNFRVPPVNFYRAVQDRGPAGIAAAVALTLMGTRIENWPEDRRSGMAAFFSRIAYKKTNEWKEEIVYPDPAAAGSLDAVFPDGKTVKIPAGEDPREVFADWLLEPGNPWFARNIVNRIWAWLMGRGIIHEPDDMRPDNPASNPELLAFLEKELVDAHYDLKHAYRLILNSGTYQQSSIPSGKYPEGEAQFASYPVRRIEAEVLADAFAWLLGIRESYSSAIPEPFTFLPDNQRAIALADGSISSPLLDMFGRPARDTGRESERSNQPSDAQRLYLLNSKDVQLGIQRSTRLRQVVQENKGDRREVVRAVYLNVLSRFPTQNETETIAQYVRSADANPKQALDDLVWSLINSKEFLYRH